MKNFLSVFFLLSSSILFSQQQKYWTVTATTQASSFPFGLFWGFMKEPIHPGIELGRGKILSDRKKHLWFREIRAGYFYHRFVQHGIPLFVQYGYRYKINAAFSVETSLGAGYFHSIAATSVLKLNANGDYVNAKGIGRAQGMMLFSLGAGYQFTRYNQKSMRCFVNYQQRLQAPFIQSYVPVLPYVQLSAGISFPITKVSKSKE